MSYHINSFILHIYVERKWYLSVKADKHLNIFYSVCSFIKSLTRVMFLNIHRQCQNSGDHLMKPCNPFCVRQFYFHIKHLVKKTNFYAISNATALSFSPIRNMCPSHLKYSHNCCTTSFENIWNIWIICIPNQRSTTFSFSSWSYFLSSAVAEHDKIYFLNIWTILNIL